MLALNGSERASAWVYDTARHGSNGRVTAASRASLALLAAYSSEGVSF